MNAVVDDAGDVDRVVEQLRAGRAVVLVDDERDDGDVLFAAELATPDLMAFTVRHTSGFVCVALTEADADRLDLPAQRHVNQHRHRTAYAVSVDARDSAGTGISATDRAQTARLVAASDTSDVELTRPGHLVVLRARPRGLRARFGRPEAAIDLMELAGLRPAGVLAAVVSGADPTRMAAVAELREFADQHQLAMTSIQVLMALRPLSRV